MYRKACDENFIKTEITLTDFVLDRLAADVHILITSVANGSGGNSIQLIFFGKNSIRNNPDTLLCSLSANATDFERRIEVVKKIKLGLIPFIANSPYSDLIEIVMKTTKVSVDNNTTKKMDNPVTKDKWNYWVYTIGADGTFNVDQVYKSTQLSGSFFANRTTEELKTAFSLFASTNKFTYEYEYNGGLAKYTVTNRDKQLKHFLVKSISDHWSVGYEASYANSTFINNKNRKYFRGAVEYAIFPYKQVNNKFFTVNYGIEVRHNKYYDTTIYNKLQEVLLGHKAQVNLSVKQKWGYINSSIAYFNYFKDSRLNNLALHLTTNIRITGGLSFYLYSNAALVHDQVYLAKGNASQQEILTRRRQLASSYNFYSGFGLNFRFGSILNNFVNPRFDSL